MGGKQVPLVNVSNWPSCVWNVAHPSMSAAVTPCHPPWAAVEQMRLLIECIAYSTQCAHTEHTHMHTTFIYTLISFLGKLCCPIVVVVVWSCEIHMKSEIIIFIDIVARVHAYLWEVSTVWVRPAILIQIIVIHEWWNYIWKTCRSMYMIWGFLKEHFVPVLPQVSCFNSEYFTLSSPPHDFLGFVINHKTLLNILPSVLQKILL